MANEEVVGARFEIDVTDLKTGIKQANQAIRLVNSEFKAASAGMDDWRTSEEGLTAKLRQLNQTADVQAQKVQALTNEYNRLAAEYGENSSEAQGMAIRLNNAQAALSKTQRDARNVEQSLNELGNEARDASQDVEKLGRSGDSIGRINTVAKGAVKGIAGLAAGIGGLIAGLFSLSDASQEVLQDMGQLETAYTQQGHSVEDAHKAYQTFYGLLGESDTATEAANNLARLSNNQEDLDKVTTAAAGAFALYADALPIENLVEGAQEAAKTGTAVSGLSDAIQWSTKSNEDWSNALSGNSKAQDAFNAALDSGATREEAFNAALQACNDEQERGTLISQALYSIYGEAGEAYMEANEGLIKLREAQGEFNRVAAEAGGAVMPLQTNLLNFASGLISSVIPSLEQVGDAFDDIFNGNPEAGAKRLAQGISGAINTVITQITNALPGMLNAGVAIITGLLDGIISAIPTLLTGLAGALPSIMTSLMTGLTNLVNSISAVLPELLLTAIPAVVEGLAGMAQAFLLALPQLVTALMNLITQLANQLPTFIPLLIDGAIQLFMAIVDALPIILPQLITALVNAIPQIVSALIACIPQLLAGAVELFMALVEAVPLILGALLSAVGSLIQQGIAAVTGQQGNMQGAARNLFMRIASAVPGVAGSVLSAVGSLLSQIPGKIAGFAGSVASAAGQMIRGMVSGIRSAGGAVWNAITNVCNNALGAIKSFFGIHSPSRVMKKLFKNDWGGGIVLGIKGAAKDVAKATTAVNKAAMPSIDVSGVNAAAARGTNGAADQSGNGGKNITFVQNNYSPKALSPAETYRQGLKLSQTLAAGV